MNSVRYFIAFWIFAGLMACTSVPESDFYESEGIISIRPLNSDFDRNWRVVNHFTSSSLQLQSAERSTVSFQFYIQSPGRYALWILSAMSENFQSDEEIFVTISNEDGFVQFQGSALPNHTEYLTWSRIQNESAQIEIEQPGFYRVTFEFNNHSGFLFDKLHLTRNNDRPPSGNGYSETTQPDVDPVLVKRLQPVMIPPEWAFGFMVWAEENQQRVAQSLLAEDILVDAVLSRPGNEQPQPQLPSIWTNNEFVASARVVEKSGEKLINDKLDTYEVRPFLLSGMQNLSDPTFKMLPAKWVHFTSKASSEQTISEALKQRIEIVANPRRATSEAPFLSIGMDPNITDNFEGEITDEIVMRWVQFSALTGLMHLYIPPNENSKLFSADVMAEIKKMTRLRSRLFPYLYSLAHLVRATANNPVRGDESYTTQFQLGEAFLVAPVYREGEDRRTIWFPEGTWYDYWSGEEYEGGQAWLVDAPISQIPLYVKAGSIIPYRSRAGQIMAGSNTDLTVEIYAGGVGTFRLYEDDGLTNRYRYGELSTTGFRYFETDDYATFTIGSTAGTFEGQPEGRSLELIFLNMQKPILVSANSRILYSGYEDGEWMYDENDQTLTIHWKQLTNLKTDFEIRF